MCYGANEVGLFFWFGPGGIGDFFLVPEPMLHMQHWKHQDENFTPKSTNRLWVIYYLYSSLRIFENNTHSSKILKKDKKY